MLLPTSAGPATNGTSPLNPQVGARQARQMQRVAVAAAVAKNAVLGFCTSPASVAMYGANLMAEVQQAPTTGLTVDLLSTVPSGGTASGSGGLLSAGPVAGVNVAPLGSSGLPPAPAIPPLTTTQGVATPSLWGQKPRYIRVSRRFQSCGRPRGQTFQNLPAGQSPTWGSAAATLPGPAAQSAAPLYQWMQDNPVLAGALAFGGLIVAAYAVGGNR